MGTVRTVQAIVVGGGGGSGGMVWIGGWFQATTAVAYRGERSAVPWGEDLTGLSYVLTGDLTGLVWNILTGELTGLFDDLTRGGFVYQNLLDGERGRVQQ